MIVIKQDVKTEIERERFKQERAKAVQNILVTSNLGRVFQGDEDSTTRMLKPIKVLEHEPEGTTTTWVLADDSVVQVGLAEFLDVLKKAGVAQTELWVMQ